ncbi:MAG: hypothetical protein GXP25_17205 [Planctomycetes bacterium]|nr:hypothetical protein [Planctomycetota bacterium]
MATAKSCKAKQTQCGGFTLIELLIAFGLMVVLLSTVYVIFDTGSKVFGKSAARLEIMEMARTLFHMMERDLEGAKLDKDGRIFRGYGFTWHGNQVYGGRKIFGLPGLTGTFGNPWRSTSFFLWASRSYNVSYNYSDLLWFRTSSAPEIRGRDAEIIYRLSCPPGGAGAFTRYYYGGTLERAIRANWPPSTGDRDSDTGPYKKIIRNRSDAVNCGLITTPPPQSYSDDGTAMQIIPLCPFCYELRFDYLDAFSWNVQKGRMHRMHDGISLDYGGGMAQREAWPPRGSWPGRARGPLSEYRIWSNANFTANECRMHLPAAVKAYVRIGDIRQAVWSDISIDFGSWQRKADGQVQVDEVGMVFEQWFFLPNHVRYPYGD